MNTFLHYVAKDIIQKYGNNLSKIAVVFPNKRASLFLNNELARLTDKPIWSPAYITISELFRQHSELQTANPLKLVCVLYRVFQKVTGSNESLDHFYGWGQLMITDFDDIDKNMADADKVFANLSDYHEFDDVSYLTPEQEEILKRFFSNFSSEHNSELKKRFLNIWSNFREIYHSFNETLAEEGLAYEGQLYRKVVEEGCLDLKYDKYLFVGFNMMQKVEQELCNKLQKEDKAAFYWDFDKYYLNPKKQGINMSSGAGHYISQYLEYYPNELDNMDEEIYDNLAKNKDISYVSATTENIQARYISKWLLEKERYKAGKRTAIVLADESLLQTVIHCIPKEVEKVNITTGYPLAQSPITGLVKQLISLQTLGYRKDLDKYRLHWVQILLHHPYIKYISEKSQEIFDDLNSQKTFYLSKEQLGKDDNLKLLFSNASSNDDSKLTTNSKLLHWIIDVLRIVGTGIGLAEESNDPLAEESIFRMYTLLNSMVALVDDNELDVDLITLEKLINQVVQSTSIPFHGEPAEGIQIMGVLETRNLDFDHVIVLSCNEGKLPKGINDNSFIPYAIRRAYGLTTIDNKVSIYSYYFHSLLQRAGDITLVYNNATSDGQTGEMSRFMLQLMVESGHKINKLNIVAQQTPQHSLPEGIKKTPEIMNIINEINRLSPTAINTYIRCQLRFYYRYLQRIKEPENDDNEMNNAFFGSIFHRVAELFYEPYYRNKQLIQKEDIDRALKNKALIDACVEQAFREILFKVSKNTHVEYNGLQLINRQVIKDYFIKQLKIDQQLCPFRIRGLEKSVYEDFDIKGTRIVKIGGSIDRLDELERPGKQPVIRVVDYKTGTNNSTNVKSLEEVFTDENLKNHTDYYLQAMLYSLIVRDQSKENLPVSPALVFIQKQGTDNADCTLRINKEPIEDIATYSDEYREGLINVVSDIFNPELTLLPTEDINRCASCPYKALCMQ
ncbi:MAG: PD-(D/E)XK nuclease family protein [Prevotella sp.]|nr:PD-(D/E)XK nuclease family protein [Prevotella sp.]